jgi:CheY-like chemotaxis protein
VELPMQFEALLSQAEQNPDDGKLIAALLIQSGHVDMESLPEAEQERLYNLLAYTFSTVANGPFNALQAALQRALTQPPVLAYFQRRMEASADFLDMMQNNPAAPVILALLCTHEDERIAQKAAIALGYSGNQFAYDMLQRWQLETSNKKLQRAAQLALPYFSTP